MFEVEEWLHSRIALDLVLDECSELWICWGIQRGLILLST